LGIGGAGHEGADLTDTMILASVSTKTKKISLISLPRDIWIPQLSDKVNSTYMYGKQKGGVKTGLALAKSTVEEILGTQIDYAVVIDFSGFKDVVDAIGGVTVNIKTSFTDNQYPIAGLENDTCGGDPTFACRYMTISFEEGVQTMDGERALEFVRSRHAVGPEGNDLAREARQQLVIAAIIKKILTPQIFTNLNIDAQLINIVSKSIITDLKPSEEATLARYIIDARANIKSYTIPDDLLYNPPNEYKYFGPQFTHAFVFIPARSDGKWDDVAAWANSVLP
jgi:LCP family protein required for cell wall assembly